MQIRKKLWSSVVARSHALIEDTASSETEDHQSIRVFKCTLKKVIYKMRSTESSVCTSQRDCPNSNNKIEHIAQRQKQAQ